MGIESGIVARCLAEASLTALIGDRLYADVISDAADKPAIAYQLISDVPIPAATSDTEHSMARIQFTIIDPDKNNRIAVADALKTALKRFDGAASDIYIKDARLENESTQAYDLTTGEASRILDFRIYYEV